MADEAFYSLIPLIKNNTYGAYISLLEKSQ
jgi:hypothetical protein